MKRLPRVALDSLLMNPQPAPCNVYVRLRGRPFRKNEGSDTDRWHVEVEGLSSTVTTRVFLAVHYTPERAAVDLPYTRTSRELLELFEEEGLRSSFRPGEEALVQAVPKWGHSDGSQALFLNVQAVLLLRPFLMVGRNLADWSHACARRTYLSYTKAVGNRRGSASWGSIGGTVTHDVVEYLACSEFHRFEELNDESLVLAGASARSLQRLIGLGVGGRADKMKSAARMPLRALRTIRRDDKLRALIVENSRWQSETTLLNNGVHATPDLLRDQQIAELKFISPNSKHFKTKKFANQITSYLAWAMVEFGVDEVRQHWKGWIVHLNEHVAPTERIVEHTADLEAIGRRVKNRHRIMALAGGRWLPSPSSECDTCEFAESDGGPAPCQYYCQTERHWDCLHEEGDRLVPCPLLGYCDQYDHYEPYERLDLFTQLRQELLEEAEEQAAVESIVELLSREQLSGWHLTGFRVVRQTNGLLYLAIPEKLQAFSSFSTGTVFAIGLAEGPTLGRVGLLRRKGNTLILHSEEGIPLRANAEVSLRRLVEARYPVRKQLAFLDQLQRDGKEPPSLRGGRPIKTPLSLRKHESIESLPPDHKLVIIDHPNRGAAEAAADNYIRNHDDQELILVVGGEGLETRRSKRSADLSPERVASEMQAREGELLGRLEDIARDWSHKNVVFVTPEDLYDDALSTWQQRRVSTILIPNAERLSLVAFQSCLDFGAERLVLVGQSLADGPRMESRTEEGGVLRQNPLQFLIQVGVLALPASLEHLELVRPSRIPVCEGLRHPFVDSRARKVVPCDRTVVSTISTSQPAPDAPLRLVQQVPMTPGHNQRCEIAVELNSTERPTLSKLRALLKNVSSLALEQLSPALEGQLDTSLLGEAVRVTTVRRFAVGDDALHELTLELPRSTFRFLSEQTRSNRDEAEAVLMAARDCEDPVVVSPFQAQCFLVARLAAERQINLRVSTCEDLALRDSREKTILVSLVAEFDEENGSFPYPLSSEPSLLPIFLTDCKRVRVFCSPSVAEHHPLVRTIADAVPTAQGEPDE